MKNLLKASSNSKLKARMATKLGKSLQEALVQLEAEKLLKQQTETFWLLQLQMLERSVFMLQMELITLAQSGLYKKNSHTKKFGKFVFNYFHFHKLPQDYTEDDHNCLATHLALQLAGVEE
jgi:hypothetical protein